MRVFNYGVKIIAHENAYTIYPKCEKIEESCYAFVVNDVQIIFVFCKTISSCIFADFCDSPCE